MNDTKRKRNKAQTYNHHTNAVCVTVYHPTGETIPVEIRDEIENSVWAVANHHKLLINIALT